MSRDLLLKFWDPLHISGTVEARNLKIRFVPGNVLFHHYVLSSISPAPPIYTSREPAEFSEVSLCWELTAVPQAHRLIGTATQIDRGKEGERNSVTHITHFFGTVTSVAAIYINCRTE